MSPQARGLAFQSWLKELMDDDQLDANASYRPKGEEIDGSFVLGGRTYLFEAKWTSNQLPASDIYAFKGKVDGKLVGTVGFHISMAGFHEDAVEALQNGKEIDVLLVDKDDVTFATEIGAGSVFEAKLRVAAERGVVYFPTKQVPVERAGAEPRQPLAEKILQVVAEGAFGVSIAGRIAWLALLPFPPGRRFGVQVSSSPARSASARILAALLDQNPVSVGGVVLADADYDAEEAVEADLLADEAVRSRDDVVVIAVQPSPATAWLGAEPMDQEALDAQLDRMDAEDLARARAEIPTLDQFAMVVEDAARRAFNNA